MQIEFSPFKIFYITFLVLGKDQAEDGGAIYQCPDQSHNTDRDVRNPLYQSADGKQNLNPKTSNSDEYDTIWRDNNENTDVDGYSPLYHVPSNPEKVIQFQNPSYRKLADDDCKLNIAPQRNGYTVPSNKPVDASVRPKVADSASYENVDTADRNSEVESAEYTEIPIYDEIS